MTVKWWKILLGNYPPDWNHYAGHRAWLRTRSIRVRNFASSRFAIIKKCMTMSRRAFGEMKKKCDVCALVVDAGFVRQVDIDQSGCGYPQG